MTAYILKRCVLIVPTLLGAACLVFALMRLVPGDVCEVKLVGEGQSVAEEEIEACRDELGLSAPVAVQFGQMIMTFVTFDFGKSMWTGRDITETLAARYELTLQLATMTLIVSVTLGIPLGIISAIKRQTLIDYAVRIFAMAGASIPSFWFGIMVIITLLVVSQWLFGEPIMTPIVFVSIWDDPLQNLSQMLLPALVAGYSGAAILTRMTRSAMLEVLYEDYMRTARSKGLPERIIYYRHAIKNAFLPVITLIGLEFAGLIGGLLVTEQLFNLNGFGNLFVEAVEQKDLDLVQAMVLFVVFAFAFINLAVDLLYGWLDPRIRYS